MLIQDTFTSIIHFVFKSEPLSIFKHYHYCSISTQSFLSFGALNDIKRGSPFGNTCYTQTKGGRGGTYIFIKRNVTIMFTVLSMICPTGTTLIEVEYQQLHGKIFEESCGDDPYVPTQNAMYGKLKIKDQIYVNLFA